jgi:16S rRNA (cytosine967-C5)-methyltransferase
MSPQQNRIKARNIALSALSHDEGGVGKIDENLEQAFERSRVPVKERALARELTRGTIQRKLTLDSVVSRLAKKKISRIHPILLNIIRLALYQIIFLDRIPDYAAVDEAVKQARKKLGRHAAGFANALLRRFLDSGKEVVLPPGDEQFAGHISIKHSHPQWLIERWIESFGEEMTEKICEANNFRSPMFIRVNRNKVSLEKLLEGLETEGIEAVVVDEELGAIRVDVHGPVTGTDAFKLGWFYIQDLTAMRTAKFASPVKGEKILDVCASPGGKCTHIAELTENSAIVFAMDRSLAKIGRVMQNVARLAAVSIVPVVGDAANVSSIFKQESFDRVIVDAPCSNTGVLRRRAEARWRLHPEDFAYYHEMQLRFLVECAPLVKKGGVMVYSTCSIDPEENQGVGEAFLEKRSDFRLEDQQAFLPSESGGDGGFMTKLSRR